MTRRQTNRGNAQEGRTTKVILALIASLTTILVGFWQFRPQEKHDDKVHNRQLSGQVVDAATEKSIQGAKVSLNMQGAPPILYTDSEGTFNFPLAPKAKYVRIRVSASGYLPYNRRIEPGSSSELEEIRLLPAPIDKPEAPLRPSDEVVSKTYVVRATARGTVFDDDSGPFGSSSESEDYSWTWEIPLTPGSPAEARDGEKCVDNEVQLRVNASFSMDLNRNIHARVQSRLFEGDACGQELEAEKSWEGAVEAGQTKDIINERIADDQGDWATFVLRVENPPQ